jgi:hypothetical protein
VSAGVHHDDAVTGAKKKFGLADNADAIIGDAVEKENPTAVGMLGPDHPAAEENAVGSADVKVLAMATGDGERGVGFADQVRGELPANGMKKTGRDEPACDACQERGKEDKDQQAAD